MLKKILIFSVLALLFLTASQITPVNAQIFDQRSFEKSGEKSGKQTSEYAQNTDDYYRIINERLVVSALKHLYDVENDFAMTYGAGEFGGLGLLGEAGLIDPVLASGEKYGYNFIISLERASAAGPPRFFITATPRHYGRTGKRSFYMDSRCQIRGGDKNGVFADVNDPVLDECSPYAAYQIEYDISYSIRLLIPAQQRYFDGVGNGTYGTLDELVSAGLLNQVLSIPWHMWLDIEVISPTKQTAAGFKIRGIPRIYRETGIRSYYADESGIIRAADLQGQFADENTPPLVFEDEELIKFAMRSLWMAQRRYICSTSCEGYATKFDQLSKTGLIDFEIINGTFGSYRFEMSVVNSQDPNPPPSFEITATPINYGKGSLRSFYISNTKFLRGADKGGFPAGEFDPIVEF